jgi:hypothetical protein
MKSFRACSITKETQSSQVQRTIRAKFGGIHKYTRTNEPTEKTKERILNL